MPYINKACDNCGEIGKEVYERYQCTPDMSIEFKAEKIGKNLFKIMPKNLEYWCTDCFQIKNVIITYE